MVLGNVERSKVHPVRFYVRAFRDRAAHGTKDGGDLLHSAADRMDQADLLRPRRQGEVKALRYETRVEFGVLQHHAASFEQRVKCVLELVERRSPLTALVGWELTKVTQ